MEAPTPTPPGPDAGDAAAAVRAAGPAAASAATLELGRRERLPTHVVDLTTTPPDVFEDLSDVDWSTVRWEDVGRPYEVRSYSRHRRRWEEERGEEMPVLVQWEHFNRAFHELFATDVPAARAEAWRRLARSLGGLDLEAVSETVRELLHLTIWNKVHRVEDAVWDPRGKRALFEGLDVDRPEILFLGAADGYEAMQLLAMYPGGHAVLVDYDDFCRTDRFGTFPEAYPFLGRDPSTGAWKVHRRPEMAIDFVVDDIRDLDFGPRFDIVLSVGLIEHFPDTLKPMAIEWHRRFVKPGGYVVMTTPRRQLRSKAFYLAMGEIMNYGYRELMDARQMGLYAWENGLEILRCGYIKAHNGIVARAR
ncbi:MAG: class I SAM-dependent methyltransferase [Gemmatimonadota bacterium]